MYIEAMFTSGISVLLTWFWIVHAEATVQDTRPSGK